MLPRSSGEYNFLRRIYHPAFGFVAGWLSATVGFAAPIALAAMAFGSYFKSIAPQAPPLMLGLGITWLAALVHLSGFRFGSAFHNVWTALKLILIVVVHHRRFRIWRSAADFICAELRRPRRRHRRAVRHQPCVCDVFLFRLECGHLYRRRTARARPQFAARVVGGHRNRHRSLCRAQRGLFGHDADAGIGRPTRRRGDRRQTCVRPFWRTHRRRADQPRAGIFHQRHDVDRPARHHDDGRGHTRCCACSRASRSTACRPSPLSFSSWSRTCCC